MVRWSYLMPRLLLVLLVASVMEWGIGPLVRLTVLPAIGSGRHVRLSADQVRIGLLSGQASLKQMTATLNTGDKQRRLTAREIVGVLDRRALLHGHWHLATLNLRGVEWREQREEVVETDQRGSSQLANWLASVDEQTVRRWGSTVADRLGSRLYDESQTARVIVELKSRWETELKTQEEKLTQWRELVRELEQRWNAAQSPAERLHLAAQLAARGRTIERELTQIYRDLDRLRTQAESDRLTLDEAQRADRKRLEALTKLPSLSPKELNEVLLGPGVIRTMERLEASWRWLRQGMNVVLAKPRSNRLDARGVDYDFDRSNQPEFWLEQAPFDVTWHRRGRPTRIRGILRDWSNEPAKLGRPIVVEWRGDDSLPVTARWVRDVAGSRPTERWQMKWSPLRVESERWAVGDEVAMTVNELVGTVWLDGMRDEDGEAGRLVWQVDRGTTSIAMSIGDQLERIPVDWSHFRDQPMVAEWRRQGSRVSLKLKSALGDHLARAAEDRAAQWARAQQTRLASKLDQRRAEFQEWLEARLAAQADQAAHLQQLVTEWQNDLARAHNAMRWFR